MSYSTQTQTYINISSNIISGHNQGLQTAINLSAVSTGSALIGINYSTTTLGFEFLPSPADNGTIRYRYAANSTTNILAFDGPNMFINITNLTAKTGSIINPVNNVAAVNLLIDPNTNGGVITANSDTGSSRVQMGVDSTQQGYINFYFNDAGLQGTNLNASTMQTQYIVGSSLVATNGLVLHPANDLSISSVLNMDIDGNLYWNGTQINYNGGGAPPTSTFSTFLSSFDYVYTSTLQTTTIIIRGSNVLSTAVLRADSSLNLYWNGQIIPTGSTDVFASTIYENAQISNVSTLRITASSIQGVYDKPALQPKWIITGTNVSSAPVYTSINEQQSYLPALSTSIFSGGGTSVYGNIYNGEIIATGTDASNSFNTIKFSNDGRNWSSIIVNNPFSLTANKVLYANNLWLIGGNSTVPGQAPILWSSDGYNFFGPTNYPIGSGNSAFDFSYSGKYYVAVLNVTFTTDTSILWSVDGKDWNRILTGGFAIKGTAVGNNGMGMWVACGQSGLAGSVNRIQWSNDAINWNYATAIPTSFGYGNSVNFANGLWHIGGSATNGLNTILTSTDGKTWTSQITGSITEVYKINYVKGRWYAAGNMDINENCGLLSSKDGFNWNKVYPSTFYADSIKDIFYLETVLLGQGSINFSPSTTMYLTATMSSYTINASNIIGSNSQLLSTNTTYATISTLAVSTIISPNFVQVQSVQF
jgi:hypothetical protein